MRVSDVKTMQEYDTWTAANLPRKVPAPKSRDLRRRLGDSIYDFSTAPPKQRPGIHGPPNVVTDLSVVNALLSDHFFYFGDAPQQLPSHLLGIVHHTQGHRVHLNQPFRQPFLDWLSGLNLAANKLHGRPALKLFAAYSPY